MLFVKFKHELKNRLAKWLFLKKCSCKISFSENAEDIMLNTLFGLFRIEIPQIRYVEIGTNHPIYKNNTYSLYLEGARGILVEPNEALGPVIRKCRPEDKLIQVGITGKQSGECYQIT